MQNVVSCCDFESNPALTVVLSFFLTLFPCLQLEAGVPLPSPQELMGKILIKNKKSHKPANTADTKRLIDQPANQSNEPVSPSNNTGGMTQRQ